MPKQPTQGKKKSKTGKTSKPSTSSEQQEPPQRPFVYTGPPLPEDQRRKLKGALKLAPRQRRHTHQRHRRHYARAP